ncbi:MAG: Gfo/Idh/MocA family protein [Thermoguttaceae bacterium]
MSETKNERFREALRQRRVSAPRLRYRPQDPRTYRPHIGLIACGGVTRYHLAEYRRAGYSVTALCDLELSRARAWRKEFFPDTAVYRDYRQVLARRDIEVVDIATHPSGRASIIEDALNAGKHVLSQKPFVLDLKLGRRLVQLADRRGLRLAVNQNGRWAPHFSYMRLAVAAGLVGQVSSVQMSVRWDHTWVQGTHFEQIHHLLLYDFAIHWFDMLACFMGERKPLRVFASLARTSTQQIEPPLLAKVVVEYENAQAILAFDAETLFGQQDATCVVGTEGTISSTGPDLTRQSVTLATAAGLARPRLTGTWFEDGFHGTMGELLCAIEEDREPTNGARDNLRSLELCFAAIASAERGRPVVPGTVKTVPWCLVEGLARSPAGDL